MCSTASPHYRLEDPLERVSVEKLNASVSQGRCLPVGLSLTNGLLDVDAETQGCLQGMSHSYDHFSQRGTEDDSHL